MFHFSSAYFYLEILSPKSCEDHFLFLIKVKILFCYRHHANKLVFPLILLQRSIGITEKQVLATRTTNHQHLLKLTSIPLQQDVFHLFCRSEWHQSYFTITNLIVTLKVALQLLRHSIQFYNNKVQTLWFPFFFVMGFCSTWQLSLAKLIMLDRVTKQR